MASKFPRTATLFMILLWLVVGGILAAEQDPARLELVADVADPVAEGGGYLGVLIRPEPGWVVAWRYGGDFGESSRIRFEVGPGLVAGEPLWQLPEVVRLDDGEVGYGYRKPTIIAVPVVPLEPSGRGEVIKVRAVIQVAACRGECSRREYVLEGVFPMPEEAVRSVAPRFDHWRRSLPPPEEVLGAVPPFSVERSGGIVRGQGWGAMSVWLHWPRNPGHVQWIPDPEPGLEVRQVHVSERGKTTRIDLTVEADAPEDALSLRSLVVANSPRGRTAYRLWLPVTIRGPGRPRSSR